MKYWTSILRLLAFRPHLYAAAFILWAIVHGLPLVVGLIIRALLNMLAGSTTLLGPLGLLIGALALVMLLRAFLLLFGFYADFSFIFAAAALLRKNMLSSILQRPGAVAVNDSIGGAISRFRDDVQEIAEFCGWTADLIYRPAFAITALAIMLAINVSLTLIIFMPLLLLMIVSTMAKRRIEAYRRASREVLGTLTGFIGDLFGAIELVKTSGTEEHMVGHLQALNTQRQTLAIKETLFSELLNTIFSNTIGLGTGLILLLAVGVMQTGSFTVGDLALFVFYLSWLGEVTHFMGRLTARFQQMGVSFERALALEGGSAATLVQHGAIYHVAETAPTYASAPTADPLQLVEVKDLTYLHPFSHRGVQHISFSLPQGSLTVVCGRVGAGKTTLLRVVLGLLPKESGHICWNGRPIEDAGDFFLPPRSAYLPQAPHLFNDTLRENILLGWDGSEEQIQRALVQAALERDVDAMDLGLDTPLGTRGIEPSGGQKQRIAAARMFVRDAELCVIDDISSALDRQTEQDIWARLRQRAGSTFLVASTRPTVLHQADNILLLEDGCLLDQGKLADILERTSAMREIFATASGG